MLKEWKLIKIVLANVECIVLIGKNKNKSKKLAKWN